VLAFAEDPEAVAGDVHAPVGPDRQVVRHLAADGGGVDEDVQDVPVPIEGGYERVTDHLAADGERGGVAGDATRQVDRVGRELHAPDGGTGEVVLGGESVEVAVVSAHDASDDEVLARVEHQPATGHQCRAQGRPLGGRLTREDRGDQEQRSQGRGGLPQPHACACPRPWPRRRLWGLRSLTVTASHFDRFTEPGAT